VLHGEEEEEVFEERLMIRLCSMERRRRRSLRSIS